METAVKIFPKRGLWGVVVLILVLLGTNPYSFSRLAKAADLYAEQSGEEVFIQLGYTEYLPTSARCNNFLSKEALLKKIEEADLIITQGGFGGIGDCLRANRRIIAVPRKPELHEAPDRQEELVRELERMGMLVAVYDVKELPHAIEKAKRMSIPKARENKISSLVNQFIMRFA